MQRRFLLKYGIIVLFTTLIWQKKYYCMKITTDYQKVVSHFMQKEANWCTVQCTLHCADQGAWLHHYQTCFTFTKRVTPQLDLIPCKHMTWFKSALCVCFWALHPSITVSTFHTHENSFSNFRLKCWQLIAMCSRTTQEVS